MKPNKWAALVAAAIVGAAAAVQYLESHGALPAGLGWLGVLAAGATSLLPVLVPKPAAAPSPDSTPTVKEIP